MKCVGSTPVCESQNGIPFVVPANKQLVINEITFKARVLNGSVPATAAASLLVTPAGTASFEFYIGILDFIDSGLNVWKAGVPMHVTAPSDSTVAGQIDWSTFGATNVTGDMIISGVLVSTP